MFSRRVFALAAIAGLAVLLTACPGTTNRPDAFQFTPVTGADLGAEVLSNEVTISGLSAPAIATVTAGGTLIINDVAATSPANVTNGSRLRVRITASATPGAMVSATVDVAGVKATFSVTAKPAGPLEFTPVDNAEPGAVVESGATTVPAGQASQVSVAGEGSPWLIVNGAPSGTSAEVAGGDLIQVGVNASDAFETTVTATVTSAGGEAQFAVTTRAFVPPVVELELDPADLVSGLPGTQVTLTWEVSGDYETLTLTTDPATTPLDVSSMNQVAVTLPSDNTSLVTYTLTADHQHQSGGPYSASTEVWVLWVCNAPDQIIAFADDALEARVRTGLGIATPTPITCADALSLSTLNARRSADTADEFVSITSLIGLQHFTNLTALYAPYNDVTDLSPLAGLTSLERLDFDQNRVTDLSPLAGLTNLELLSFWDNGPTRYSEIPAISSCRDGISDLTPLSGMVNLQDIYMSCNDVESLEPLAGMTDLRLLYTISNRVVDLSPLNGKDQLRILRVSDNPLADDAALFATLPDLAWLGVEYSQLHNQSLTGLGALTDLYIVQLEGNYFSDLTPLIDNAAFPAATGSGDPQEPYPGATVSLAYNCIADFAAAEAAFGAKGVTVTGGPPYTQRDADVCLAHGAGITGADTYQQGLEQFRQRIHVR